MNRLLVGALTAALAALCDILSASTTLAVASESTGLPPQNTITMNFQNVDIPVLAKFICEITGSNFIIDESVRGKVTIISPSKVTPEQAYSIFQSVLQVKGFTTVQARQGHQDCTRAQRALRPRALTQSQNPAETKGDEYVTRMVQLNNIDAASIIGVIQPMVSHDGLVAAFPADNTLIITDDAYNVERLLQIIGSLDVRGKQQIDRCHPAEACLCRRTGSRDRSVHGAPRRPAPPRWPVRRWRCGRRWASRHRPPGTASGLQSDPRRAHQLPYRAAPPLQMREIQDIVEKLDVNPPAVHVANPRLSAQERAGARDGPGAQQPAQRRRAARPPSRPAPAKDRWAARSFN